MLLNFTIDDEYGDSLTSALPQYEFARAWHQGSHCPSCATKLDSNRTFKQSWHDSTSNGGDKIFSVTFEFTGVALYVYCIITHSSNKTASYTFRINDTLVGQYTRQIENITEPEYQTLVFSETDLPQGRHTFQFQNGGPSLSSLALFDYAVYTMDNSSTAGLIQPVSDTLTWSGIAHAVATAPLSPNVGHGTDATNVGTSSFPVPTTHNPTTPTSPANSHVQTVPIVVGILIGAAAALLLSYLLRSAKHNFARWFAVAPETIEPFPFVENWREVNGADPLSPSPPPYSSKYVPEGPISRS
ncbi:hypothetical protein ONZ45_g10712 [Pleurotus djamor]|nr:hypothetical protein ONZ45_g10712 [Pleurotus djamor]